MRRNARGDTSGTDSSIDVGLLARLCNGDEQALGAIMERHAQHLLNFIIQYVESSDAAEDVLQDVFVRLWEHRGRLRADTVLRPYLYTVARNAALDARKRQARRSYYEEATDFAERAGAHVAAADTQVEDAEFADAVKRAVAALSPRSREVLLLSIQHGLSQREIAATLGVAPATVQTHLARAVTALGRALRPFLALALMVMR